MSNHSASPLTDTMELLREQMLLPVQTQLDKINAAIDEKVAELVTLREQKRELQRWLTSLDPASKPGPKRPRSANGSIHKRAAPLTSERIDAAAKFLMDYDFPDNDVNAALLDREYRAAGGQPKLSAQTWRGLLDHFHQTGVVRFDRTGSAGGRIYKVVGK